jgi:hypothetical protein
MMRLEHAPPREMLRALVTAVGALRRSGVPEPARHIVTLTQTNGAFTALLVKKTPFNEGELGRLRAWVTTMPFVLTASPDGQVRSSAYESYLRSVRRGEDEAFLKEYPFTIAPSTDDWPFFFRFSKWSHLDPDSVWRRNWSLPVMEWTLLSLALVFGFCACFAVGLPLARRTDHPLATREAGRATLFFGAIGLGYLLVEIALLQRLGLILGHPNRALSVVLACLLLFSGIGAYLSSRWVGTDRALRLAAAALCGVILVLWLIVFPLTEAFLRQPGWLAVVVAILAAGVPGLLMGVFMPLGLSRLAENGDGALVPWAWGVNGMASVMAPIAAIGVSMEFGSSVALLLAIPCYVAATSSVPKPRSIAGP